MNLKQNIKNSLKRVPYAMYFRNYLRNVTGHYYSPLSSLKETKRIEKKLFKKEILRGIDLDFESQLEKLKLFSEMHEKIPFYNIQKRIRFNIDNESFTYDDAPILHYMMRLLRPSKIVEIGCGNSSACMLDTNDLYLDGKVQFTFIDVLLKDLREMLRDGDYGQITMIEEKIQDVDLEFFKELKSNDILFIDSSHVIKIGSDLNTILFEILPLLNSGVHIHFHDIRYPFEYMIEDINKRVYWNEAYILRAFLQYNNSFKISFWLNYLLNLDYPEVEELASFLPLDDWADRFGNYVKKRESAKDKYANAGGSIWLTKTRND